MRHDQSAHTHSCSLFVKYTPTHTHTELGINRATASRIAQGHLNMSHHCKLMLNTAVELGVAAVTLASDPGYVLGAEMGQVLRYGVTAFTRDAHFFSGTNATNM